MILAVDTSGGELVAVALDDELRAAAGEVIAGRRHQERIVEVLERVFARAGGTRALTAVAVVRGPGSQAGLRVGLATAEGLAFARRLPLFPLASLDVAAHRAAGGGRVLAAVSAGRRNLHVQAFESNGQGWRPAGERALLAADAVASRHAGLPVAGEPAVVEVLAAVGMHPVPGLCPGDQALAAAARVAVTGGEGVAYDQLTGDY